MDNLFQNFDLFNMKPVEMLIITVILGLYAFRKIWWRRLFNRAVRKTVADMRQYRGGELPDAVFQNAAQQYQAGANYSTWGETHQDVHFAMQRHFRPGRLLSWLSRLPWSLILFAVFLFTLLRATGLLQF